VTTLAKIGHVGTNYTPSLNRPFLSNGKEYLCSNFMAIGHQHKNYISSKFEKISQNLCAHMPCFVGLSDANIVVSFESFNILYTL